MHNTLLLVDNNITRQAWPLFISHELKQWTQGVFSFFLSSLTETNIVGILQGAERHQIIVACPYKAPSIIAWSCHDCSGDGSSPEFLDVDHPYFRLSHWRTWSSLLWQITFRTSFFACCYTHFLEARFSGAWFARPEHPRQRSTVIIPTLNFADGWVRFGPLDRLSLEL